MLEGREGWVCPRMRGALRPKVKEVYRFYTVPASNTAVGHIILDNSPGTAGKRGSARKATAARPNARKAKRQAAKTKRAAALVRQDVRRGR